MKNSTYPVYDIRDILTIRGLIESSAELFGPNVAFLENEAGGTVHEVTYDMAMHDVKALSTYLCSLGLEGKTVGVIGKNSYKWALTYLSVCSGVGVIMPIDRDLCADDVKFVVTDSEASAIIYDDSVASAVEALPENIIKLKMSDFADFIAKGNEMIAEGDTSYARHKIDPNALGILLYTSGTMGAAKGVMLSQYNICSNIVHVLRRMKVTPDDRALSVLPLHHTYECMAGFLSAIYSGASIAYNTSLRTLRADFEKFKPTIFVTVPLVLEQFYTVIQRNYSKLKGGKALFATQSALAKSAPNSAKRKIFSSVNEFFGGRLHTLLVGAAPLRPELYSAFENFGIRVLVGYGLTETSPVCIMHNDFYRSPKSMGYPLTGVKVELENVNEDGVGELVVSGSNVMLGYFKNPEETERVLCDGKFKTGDLAKRNPDGSYSIAGRIKSMIVLKNGKKVFPEELESKLLKSKYIGECMVFGSRDDDDTVITAAVFPDADALRAAGITESDPEYDKTVRELIFECVKDVNKTVPQYKHIKNLIIRKKEFEKTTTKKIKRLEKSNMEEN